MLKKGKSGDYPPFREAIKKLTACLKEQNYPTEIRWLMPEDCALKDGQLHVRLRDQEGVEVEVLEQYTAAIERKLGVQLSMLCTTEDLACCYLFAPTTETEAEYALMPNGLKLGVPLAPCSATLIPTFATNLWAELSKASQSELVRDLFS